MQVLLSKYSAQEDIVVGVPHANRDQSELHALLGPFTNTLALRLDLADDPIFSTVLSRTKTVAAEAFAHSSAPFARVVDALGIERSAAFTPVYQVRLQLLRLHTERVCWLSAAYWALFMCSFTCAHRSCWTCPALRVVALRLGR